MLSGPGAGKVNKVLRGPRNVCRQIYLMFTETSVRSRRVRVRRGRGRKCTQRMYWFTNVETNLPERMYKNCKDCSNQGDSYGPVALEPWSSLPGLSVADKKTFWAKRRVAVGGKTYEGESLSEEGEPSDVEAEEEGPATNAGDMAYLPNVNPGRGARSLTADTVQPIQYHELPISMWEDVLVGLGAAVVCDLTPCSGRLATPCISNRIPYIGICQSDAQMEYIKKQMQNAVEKGLGDPACKLYNPKFKRAGANAEDPTATKKAKAAAKAETKAATVKPPPPKATAKAAPNTETGGSAGSSGSAGGGGVSEKLAAMLKAAKESAAGAAPGA